jgi:hypothetical protein
MAEDYPPTVRIRRPKVTTDERGRTVWADKVETVQLELVSTGMLQKILQSSDDETRTAIESIVNRPEEGVLARDPATGLFEIISEADLQSFMKENDNLPTETPPAETPPAEDTLEPVHSETDDDKDELSLVSTQVLRKILHKDSPMPVPKKKDKGGGFDPYDSG